MSLNKACLAFNQQQPFFRIVLFRFNTLYPKYNLSLIRMARQINEAISKLL